MTIDELISSLKNSGVVLDSVVRFDEPPGPRHVRYIDLIQSPESKEALPDAVVESGGHPFAYVVRRDRLGDILQTSSHLAELLRVLACRADARYLCVVTIGTLEVFPIGLFEAVPAPLAPTNADQRLSWKTLLSAASPLSIKEKRSGTDAWLETLLFRLLLDAAKGTQKAAPMLSIQQVLALIGRALFFRFLVDRGIVCKNDLGNISSNTEKLEDLFKTPAALIDTCNWLDGTFNGDLLSLEQEGDGDEKDYESLLQQIGQGIEMVCWHLSNIQYRALGGQLPLDWGGIKFKHVPVDVLSQVYEDFAHEFVPVLATTTSVHFTPRRIAEIVIDGAFSAVQLPEIRYAKVLDPAAGGGVFLVLAFRRLVAEHWKAQGTRPTRRQIRLILNTQIKGFDINCDALNIAALSLYLAALELDPSPSPLNDLKFDKLIGTVLFPVQINHAHSLQRGCADAELGSLSSDALHYDEGSFDIVVANPPWTGFKGSQAELLDKRLASLLAEEDSICPSTESAETARYGSPDVAFLLAATKWAKPGGALGFILHARFLFQESTYPLRSKIFSRIRVTGVMNFAALRQDKKLWPTNSAPFALCVACNEKPRDEDSFYFISPRHEAHLADIGQFRVDPTAAIPVPLHSVKADPVAFKAIFKGGLLGFKLLTYIRNQGSQTIGQILSDADLKFTSGYQTGKIHNQVQDAKHLQHLPMATVDMSFCVNADAAKFHYEKVQWARTPEIYSGPLLLFRESPKLERRFRGALYCQQSTVYSESFSGLSFIDKPQFNTLIDLLYVVSYSDLFLYHQLLSSSKFGVERDAALQKDMDAFPLIDVEKISKELCADISATAQCLRNGEACWEQVDQLVGILYELTSADEQLIRDTLLTELPFTETKKNASAPATQSVLTDFVKTFNDMISPFDTDHNLQTATLMPWDMISGWTFIKIQRNFSEVDPFGRLSENELQKLVSVAGSYWATQLKVQLEDGSELVGRLDHRRYWTATQARLLALDWLQKPSFTEYSLRQ